MVLAGRRGVTTPGVSRPAPNWRPAAARGGPEGAFYSKDYGEFILPYDRVARAASPDETLLEFLQSTYEAAAMLGAWDRAALENDFSIHGRQ